MRWDKLKKLINIDKLWDEIAKKAIKQRKAMWGCVKDIFTMKLWTLICRIAFIYWEFLENPKLCIVGYSIEDGYVGPNLVSLVSHKNQ